MARAAGDASEGRQARLEAAPCVPRGGPDERVARRASAALGRRACLRAGVRGLRPVSMTRADEHGTTLHCSGNQTGPIPSPP